MKWFVASLTALLTGCPSASPPSPCTVDPVGCASTSAFAIQCHRDGALDVQLGTGETVFLPIDATNAFEVHHGAQGGEHVFAAIRVSNPALDYPQLQVQLAIADGTGAEIGSRQLVLGPPLPVVAGVVEQAGIVVFGTALETGARIRVTVTDPCGRSGQVERPFPQ